MKVLGVVLMAVGFVVFVASIVTETPANIFLSSLIFVSGFFAVMKE